MKYCQLDQITSLVPGQSITATRTLRENEEHLLDHFPRFPVMPGVMMLEALHQAAIWLVRATDGFEAPVVLLREARSVKFGEFLAPDETLEIEAKMVKADGPTMTIKATAQKDGKTTVSARLVLQTQLTGDCERVGTDADVRTRIRQQFVELFQSDQFDAAGFLPAAAAEAI